MLRILFLILVLATSTVSAQTNNKSFTEIEPIIELARIDNGYDSPAYNLSIYSDGKIIFEGKQNVKKLGIIESKLSKSKLDKLIASFEGANLSELADKYIVGENCPEVITHSPTVLLFFRNK